MNDTIDEGRVRRILAEIGYADTGAVGPGEAGRLVTYVVADRHLDPSEIAASGLLPLYMVPSQIVRLEQIPLTRNGKVDYAELPTPPQQRPELTTVYTPPRNDTEAWLVDAWVTALRIDRVGVHDDFFDLGGDSISAIQIGARAASAGLRLDPNLLFQHSTIAELAARVALPIETNERAGGPRPAPFSLVDERARTKVLDRFRKSGKRKDR